MFVVVSLIFLIFTGLYALLAFAIFYHLSQYTIEGYRAPKFVAALFIIPSSVLWVFALYFLLQIPK